MSFQVSDKVTDRYCCLRIGRNLAHYDSAFGGLLVTKYQYIWCTQRLCTLHLLGDAIMPETMVYMDIRLTEIFEDADGFLTSHAPEVCKVDGWDWVAF